MRIQNYILTIISAALITLGCTQSFILEDNSTPAPKPTPTPELTSAPYAVGDYYNDGKKEGVVFEVWDDGNSGKIVSMTQSAEYLRWSSDEAEQKRFVGANSETDGAANMAVIKSISGWEDKYPAFKWCADLGEGWYLPAKEELLTIYSNKAAIDANLTEQLTSSWYWSSTEYDFPNSDGVLRAWRVRMYEGAYGSSKSNNYYVRAVSAFSNAKPTPEPAPTPTSAIDLSADGTANCYLVQSAGNYKFKVGAPVNNISTADSAEVLWESFGTSETPAVGDLVKDVVYENGYVTFSTADVFKNGNASIAVKDSKGIILWSWHIWCSEEGWNDQVYPNNAGTMMDRNLGATSATPGDIGAFGLLYQWGRKDPFMGSCAKEGTTLVASTGSWNVASGSDDMAITIRNPMTFETEWNGGCVPGEGWHTSESEKGLYDPCPVGYRVPNGGENGFWTTALGASSSTSAGTTWDSINDGMYWTLADGKSTAWYPAVGFRNNNSGALRLVGERGYCWSASPNPSGSSDAYYLYFNYNGNVSPATYNFSRAVGYSVRCVREYTR